MSALKARVWVLPALLLCSSPFGEGAGAPVRISRGAGEGEACQYPSARSWGCRLLDYQEGLIFPNNPLNYSV